MKYRPYCHISICLLSLYFLRPFLALLTSFPPGLLPVFSLPIPLFPCLYNFLTARKGCFTPTIHLSLMLSSPFPSFFSSLSLFLFLSSFFLSFSSFSLSLSPCRFLVRRPPPCRTASDGSDKRNIENAEILTLCWNKKDSDIQRSVPLYSKTIVFLQVLLFWRPTLFWTYLMWSYKPIILH